MSTSKRGRGRRGSSANEEPQPQVPSSLTSAEEPPTKKTKTSSEAVVNNDHAPDDKSASAAAAVASSSSTTAVVKRFTWSPHHLMLLAKAAFNLDVLNAPHGTGEAAWNALAETLISDKTFENPKGLKGAEVRRKLKAEMTNFSARYMDPRNNLSGSDGVLTEYELTLKDLVDIEQNRVEGKALEKDKIASQKLCFDKYEHTFNMKSDFKVTDDAASTSAGEDRTPSKDKKPVASKEESLKRSSSKSPATPVHSLDSWESISADGGSFAGRLKERTALQNRKMDIEEKKAEAALLQAQTAAKQQEAAAKNQDAMMQMMMEMVRKKRDGE